MAALLHSAMPEAYTNPGVGPADRLSFTLFLAIALHAAIILGVTFTYVARQPTSHTMEVTLAQHRSNNRPEKSDFLAQFNQTGSGTLAEKALLTAPSQAEFEDAEIREVSQPTQQSESRKAIDQSQTVITTISSTTQKVTKDAAIQDPPPVDAEKNAEKTVLSRSLEIASLEARLDQQRQIYAKRPRIKRLTSLSTASSSDAYYLNSWRRKIESIGNLNYPKEARDLKLYSSLRLMVAITPDGALKEVEILESSGHKVLDDAAIRIVRLAAPYAPFSDELRKTTDVLEIIRTWQFRKNSSLQSY